MKLVGTTERYGILAVALHWTSAAVVLVLLPLGFLAARSSDAARTVALLRAHAPLGLIALALTIVRLVWRGYDRRPAAVLGPRWRTAAAAATHRLLYGLLIMAGASGVALLVASGAAPVLFGGRRGLPPFDRIMPMAVHAACALALVGLVVLHVAAALYHHFIRRDGVLRRIGFRSVRS